MCIVPTIEDIVCLNQHHGNTFPHECQDNCFNNLRITDDVYDKYYQSHVSDLSTYRIGLI